MAYTLKSREEFNKYLNKVHVLPSGDELLIDDFNSSSLFDLYTLLTELKDDRQISVSRQKKLRKKLKANFSEELASLLKFPITSIVLHSFEEKIKDAFLSNVNNPSPSISRKEFDNLKIIMAKKYPMEFVKLAKKEKDSGELKLEKTFLEETVLNIAEEHSKHTKNEQSNEDAQTGYYTISNNYFPKASISTTGRQKGFKSSVDNIRKEFKKSLEALTPSSLAKGTSYSDLTKQFNLSKVSDDYYAFTVYVTGLDDTFHISADAQETKEGKEFRKYRKQKEKNVPFYHSLFNFLHEPSSFLDFTEEEYLQIKIELLDKLQDLTYPECSEEYEGILFKPKDENDPGTSFSKLLEASLKTYRNRLKSENFKQNLTQDEHSRYQEELLSLFEEFDSRMNDKLEFAALKIMVPEILKDKNFMRENVLRDQLEAKVLSIEPKAKGRKGFVAIFAILQFPDGRKTEIQFLSYSRYKGSKDGNYAHNRMDSKQLDISPFFELKDEFKNSKNYNTTLKNAINILDNTTIAKRNRLLATPIDALTLEQKRERKDIEFALKNLQVKENYTFENTFITKRKGPGNYETKKITHEYTIEEYLPKFAQYHAPRLLAVSSPHSRFNKNTAFVNIKTLSDNFREILLKEDETTCLADILLKRLQQIQEKDPYITLHESNMRQILETSGLPIDKIDSLIQQMSKQSRRIRLPYTNSVSDIKERIEEKNNAER